MKRTIFFILVIMFCLSAAAQQTPLNNFVDVDLPKGAEKLKKEKLQGVTTSSDKHVAHIDRKSGKGDFYLVNGILIQLNGIHTKLPKNYLEETKKGLDGLHQLDGASLPPHFSSSIRTINNNRVLIMTYAGSTSSVYRFFCVNNTLTSVFNGVLEFKESDRPKASDILDKLLKSVKFKQ